MDRDVLIIGGGPSGLSTALHLQRIAPHLATQGASRILILEKARYPRPKLCAGGLVLDAEILLRRLGLDVTEIPHVDADLMRFEFRGKGLGIRVPRKHSLRVIRRNEFDNWLAGKAKERGIEILEGIMVQKITSAEDGVTVETDRGAFRAQIVVGADGSNGITRRCLFPHAPVRTARVLEVLTHPHRPSGTSPKSNGFEGGRERVAYFKFFPVPNNIAGYVWDFPTQVDGVPMRCWGIYDTNILANGKRPQLKQPLAEEMERFGFDLSEYEIQGHPIRWFSPRSPISAPRILLVGDAAGADPLLGEGISMALGYGLLAAQEVSESLRRDEFSFKGFKRRVLRSGLGRSLLARWAIAHFVYPMKWAWFQILLWRVMKPVLVFIAWAFVIDWGKKM
jgi:flavin-dependent dehydrogenase